MDNAARIAALVEIYGHRITTPEVDGEWIVARATKSSATMAKFDLRAKSAGIPGFFARGDRRGCRAAE